MTTEDYKLLIITKPEKIVQQKVNEFIKFCNKYEALPIFVTTTTSYETDITHTMYSNIEDVLEDSFEYIHHEDDKDSYKYMLDLLTRYLW